MMYHCSVVTSGGRRLAFHAMGLQQALGKVRIMLEELDEAEQFIETMQLIRLPA